MCKKTSRKTKRGTIDLQDKKSALQKQKVVSNKRLRAKSERQKQESMEERLRFEMLLADISARFINLPSEQVDKEIEGAQRDVCDFLGMDLSALWQWSGEDAGFFTMTHLYRPFWGGHQLPSV